MKILIPTDFSDNAQHALEYALEFAKNSDTIFQLIHVVSPIIVESPNAAILNSVLLKELRNTATNKLDRIKSFALERMDATNSPKNSIETAIVVGDPIYKIREMVSDLKIDLVIMGTQGTKHNPLEKVFGTVSKSIINKSPCPTLLVPCNYNFKEINDIVFASNLKIQEPQILNKALEILKPFEPNVRCLHVSNDDIYELDIEETAKQLVDSSTAKSTIFNIEYAKNRIDAFEEYASNYRIDMIVMQRSNMNFLHKIIRKNLPSKLVDRLHIPLLVLNDSQN